VADELRLSLAEFLAEVTHARFLSDFQGCNHYFLFCARVCGSAIFILLLSSNCLSQAHCQRLHNTRVLYCALLLPRSRRYHSILFTSTLKAAALGFGFTGTSSTPDSLSTRSNQPLPKICPLTTRLEPTNFHPQSTLQTPCRRYKSIVLSQIHPHSSTLPLIHRSSSAYPSFGRLNA